MQKTHNQFVFEMQSKNSNITILGKYIKSTVKIKCRCNVCNYEFEARPNDLLNGHGCPQCKRIKLSEMYKHSHEDFLKKISDKIINVNIISTYKGSHKNVHCLCNICNKEFDILANNLLKHGCPICGVKRRVIMRTKSHEDFLVEMNKQNKKIKIIGKYINAKEPIECMCEICNNKWFATPDSLLNGTGCPNCKIYKGEKQILDYLESHEVIFERQKTYNDLIGIGGKKLSYDFYLPTKRLFIEYNGEQHYIPIDFFGGQDKFNIQQEHDKRKEEYAHKMDIKLLIIPYWNFDNIENILEKALKEVA